MSLISLIIIHFFALLSPGPDLFLTINNSISKGRISGILISFGIGIGNLFHTIYSILFLDYLFNHLPNILTIVKYFGGAYIFFIGYKSIKESFRKENSVKTNTDLKKMGNRYNSFFLGITTNILNPKCALFFISFYGFLVPHTYTLFEKFMLGFWMMGVSILFFSSLALLSTVKYVKKTQNNRKINLITFLFGILLIISSISIVVTDFKM